MSQSTLSSQSYMIGIICALAIEKAAVVGMLDEEHPRLKTQRGDDNDYTLGKVGVHNVAVACLPAGVMGKVSAATVARDMVRSFPIKIGLMVGIGGGVWSKKADIRLGDVVVSQPDGLHGGVVQWDFGKMEQDGVFRRTGMLNKPPRPLLNAIQTLKARHEAEDNKIPAHLAEMVRKKPRMALEYKYQGATNDHLFEADYGHVGGDDCEQCDTSRIMKREAARDATPYIFYGNVASGDEVMKDGTTRDRIAEREGIICFEMEAAGLMDSFPCLAIRGICDYADSHNNKKWQRYAAATAAAYAKELLAAVDRQEVECLATASPRSIHLGSGSINSYEGSGNQENYINSGTGHFYKAERISFGKTRD